MGGYSSSSYSVGGNDMDRDEVKTTVAHRIDFAFEPDSFRKHWKAFCICGWRGRPWSDMTAADHEGHEHEAANQT